MTLEAVHPQRFQLIRRLGAGGMSTVSLARDRETGHLVAWKVLNPNLLRGFPEERRRMLGRFAREARLLKHLGQVPQVVDCLDAGLEETPPWIAMEVVRGRSLRHIIDRTRGRVPPVFLRAVALDLARGLAAIHKARVLHRDLAPANIMVVKDERGGVAVKFLDFGIGKPLGPELDPVTRKPTLMGKPQYLSPEQTRGVELEASSDVYSLGVILYEMMTGRCPIDVTSFAEVGRIRHEAPVPFDKLPASRRFPDTLRDVVMNCLAKEPADRPTLSEVIRVLEAWMDDGGAVASYSRLMADMGFSDPREDNAPPTLLSADQVLEVYRVADLIRREPGDEVWGAVDMESGRNVSMRVIAADASARRQLMTQARRLAEVSDDALHPVWDVFEWNALAVIVSAPHTDLTLADLLLRRQPMEPARFLDVALGLMDALMATHRRTPPLCHGRLGPAHVLLDTKDRVRLTGFGAARGTTDVDLHDEADAFLIHGAPEVLLGESPTPASDLYSLSVLLYTMASGRPPFEGTGFSVILAHRRHLPPAAPIEAVDKRLGGFGAHILEGMEKSPDDRPASIEEMRAALIRCLASGRS